MPKISLKELLKVVKTEKYDSVLETLKEAITADPASAYGEVRLYPRSRSLMPRGQMLTMLLLMKPFASFPELPLTADFILPDYSKVGSFDKYFDRVIQLFHATYPDSYNSKIKYDLMDSISYSLNELTKFSAATMLVAEGPTVSIKDILDVGKTHPEFKEAIEFTHETHTSHLENIQERIKLQDQNNKVAVDAIIDSGCQFSKLIKSGGGVNINQLGEVVTVVGYKPDIAGRVISRPVDSSFFRGITSIQDFYTDATGARKALNTSKMQVRQSGYLNRKISVLTEDARIDDVDDCGTKHYLRITIQDEDMLKLYVNRICIIEGVEKVITPEDKHLIGVQLLVRSPITCACPGDHVCHKCYGRLSLINSGLNIGTVANLIFTEPITQKLLSTKHLLKAKVDMKWSEDFLKTFVVDGNNLTPKQADLQIHIDSEDLRTRDYNVNRYSTRRFYILNKKGERHYFESPVTLMIPDREITSIQEFYDEAIDGYTYSLADLSDADYLFSFIIRNTGVADPLLQIKDSLEKRYIVNKDLEGDLHKFTQHLMELLVKSGTYVQAVHVEVIISCLTQMLKGTDRLKDEAPLVPGEDYRILNIDDAIYHSPSPIKSFMYQQNIRQLETDTFNGLFEKKGESEFDRLFIRPRHYETKEVE